MNYMVSNATELFNSSAQFCGYFWNGLLAVLYEPIREQYPLDCLTDKSNNKGYYFTMSISSIKDYLSCKTRLDMDLCKELCRGIQINIEEIPLADAAIYATRAFAYVAEQTSNHIASRSKIDRKKIFDKADALMDDACSWNQILAQAEAEKTQILQVLGSLSTKELSLLYRFLDGYPFPCGNDDVFMECYCRLNKKGQALFREALDVIGAGMEITYHDEFCDFCQKMAEYDSSVLQDITSEMLYAKIEQANYTLHLENIEVLLKYLLAEPKDWQALESFHKTIHSFSEGNIDGLPFSETDNLLIFLHWLENIPSLCK